MHCFRGGICIPGFSFWLGCCVFQQTRDDRDKWDGNLSVGSGSDRDGVDRTGTRMLFGSVTD